MYDAESFLTTSDLILLCKVQPRVKKIVDPKQTVHMYLGGTDMGLVQEGTVHKTETHLCCKILLSDLQVCSFVQVRHSKIYNIALLRLELKF